TTLKNLPNQAGKQDDSLIFIHSVHSEFHFAIGGKDVAIDSPASSEVSPCPSGGGRCITGYQLGVNPRGAVGIN
ncbi:hypothetical protein, partial [Phyllobacterium sp. P5_D12]